MSADVVDIETRRKGKQPSDTLTWTCECGNFVFMIFETGVWCPKCRGWQKIMLKGMETRLCPKERE